jgi:hypothetical protein
LEELPVSELHRGALEKETVEEAGPGERRVERRRAAFLYGIFMESPLR